MVELHCPFCGWNRIKDTAKGTSQVWNEDAVLRQLVEHLQGVHPVRGAQLLDLWTQRVEMVHGT